MVASVGSKARTSVPVKSSVVALENEKLTPPAETRRAAPAMLLPNALDKAAVDENTRRAGDSAARKAALINLNLGVIRLR